MRYAIRKEEGAEREKEIKRTEREGTVSLAGTGEWMERREVTKG